MSKSSLNNCHRCDFDEKEGTADCASCTLDAIRREREMALKRRQEKEKYNPTIIEEDDYSISEEFTSKGNDYSILYLVIAAVATFALVVVFTKMFV